MNIFDVDIVYEDLLCFVYTICKRIIYQNRQNSIPVSLYNLINVLKKYEYVDSRSHTRHARSSDGAERSTVDAFRLRWRYSGSGWRRSSTGSDTAPTGVP